MTQPRAVVTPVIQVGAAVNGTPGKLRVQLAYEPNDPYAVHVFLTGVDDVTTEWAFARSLLADGTTELCGDGDAQVWPGVSRFGRGPRLLMVLLSSPHGRTQLTLPYGWVREFLLGSFAAVPHGLESGHLDVDRAVRELLRCRCQDCRDASAAYKRHHRGSS